MAEEAAQAVQAVQAAQAAPDLPGQPRFALTPALLQQGNFIDFSLSDNQKLFNRATKPLNTIFTGNKDQMSTLQQDILNRVGLFGYS